MPQLGFIDFVHPPPLIKINTAHSEGGARPSGPLLEERIAALDAKVARYEAERQAREANWAKQLECMLPLLEARMRGIPTAPLPDPVAAIALDALHRTTPS